MALSVGDTVTRGQVIGLVGDTGQSTGPHLHFGIMIGTETIDPLPWIETHANS
jgi:murein DD-endopeptidase MepM/ murein hydrolase activator NlpD